MSAFATERSGDRARRRPPARAGVSAWRVPTADARAVIQAELADSTLVERCAAKTASRPCSAFFNASQILLIARYLPPLHPAGYACASGEAALSSAAASVNSGKTLRLWRARA